MVDSNSGTEPHFSKLKENQTFSCPLVFLSDVSQDNAIRDSFQAVELALGSTNLPEINTVHIEVFSDVEPADITEIEGQSTDFRNEPPDQGSPNPSHEPSLGGTGDGILFHEMEKSRIDPNTREDIPKRLSGTLLENSEHTSFMSEIQKQGTEEMEMSEAPAKKRLRRRMGMCGLGDRKWKLLFDGQHCRQGVLGRPREGVQHLGNTVLEIDGFISVEHEGAFRPECEDNEEVLKGIETNQAAEVEKRNRYPQTNSVNKCTSLINDECSTEESPEENTDNPSKGFSMENVGTVNEKITIEKVVLEPTSVGVGRSQLSPKIWKNMYMSKNKLSVDASTSDCGMEPSTCGEEPKFSMLERTSNGQDAGSNMKQKVLAEKPNLHANNKVNGNPDEITTEAEVAQEVRVSLICPIVGRPKVSLVTNKVETGFQDGEIHTEAQSLHSTATSVKPNPSAPDWNGFAENVLEPLLVDNLSTATNACMKIHYINGHDKKDEPFKAVPQSKKPDAINCEEISKRTATSTGQDNHLHCLLDHKLCDAAVTPTVAEQKVHNPTLTPAPDNLLQETDLSDSSLLYSMTDSQLHKFTLSMEMEDQGLSERTDHQEDATELVRGLIRELSTLNRTVMAAHREMEVLRRGKLPKAPNRHLRGPRRSEM